MPGLKHSPVTVIVLGLINGINALAITLLPWDSSSIFSTTCVFTPVLTKSVLVVVVVLTDISFWTLPTCDVNLSSWVSTTPLHWVCHAFQTVPRTPLFLKPFCIVLKLPSTFIINAGTSSVSNHSSPSGLNESLPTHWWIRYVWTFSTLVAYGWFIKDSSV